MKSTLSIVLIWIFKLVKCYEISESLSFSHPIKAFTPLTSSYWHGTVNSTLLENNIQFNIYLNKPKGLLFYAIDNLYQSLWFEFKQNYFIVSYFNFKTKIIDQYEQSDKTLCNMPIIDNSNLSITISLSNTALMFHCNDNSQKIFYKPNRNFVNSESMKSFLDEMKLPIPNFNGTVETHIWIGNTPGTNTGFYRNSILKAQENLLGCVQSFKVANEPIKLVTSGTRHGNMIEPFCKPICSTNPCSNGARCMEQWRQRFFCQCGLTGFTGTLCNQKYSVAFNGDLTVKFELEYKLQNFQISFKKTRTLNNEGSFKIFSIQFTFSQSLYVYIDNRQYLQIMFITEERANDEITFTKRIKNNKEYVLFIDADINKMIFKLVDSNIHSIIDQKVISRSLPNLLSQTISVGDSHSASMNWMKRFTGCISNLQLKAGKRTFLWNTIKKFDELPTCEKKPIIINTRDNFNTSSKPSILSNESSRSNVKDPNTVNSASMAYVITGVVAILLIVIIVFIITLKYLQRRKRLSTFTKKPLVKEKTLSFDTIIYQPYSAPNSPPIKFKPPYKAGSFSNTNTIGKSVTSLPSSVTATLVTPEDGDC